MKPITPCLAALALVPAALNPSLAMAASGIVLDLCGQSGASVTVPVKTPPLPGSDGAACCSKGCHNAQERKRGKLHKTT
jgi:hypothetical protein